MPTTLDERRTDPIAHNCTLCLGKHAPFQCARAQVNNGVARPNWARRETKLAVDQNREPDLRWDKEGNLAPLPPPVEPPPQDEQQQTLQKNQTPLCAAAIAMHGPPPTMHPMSSTRQSACPTVHEERVDRAAARGKTDVSKAGISCLSQPLEHRHPRQGYETWSNGILLASCDFYAVPGQSNLQGYLQVSRSSSQTRFLIFKCSSNGMSCTVCAHEKTYRVTCVTMCDHVAQASERTKRVQMID